MNRAVFTPADKGNLPETFGCYQYLDADGTIIYVGKAKNLKRRVSSYFNKTHDDLKTRMLVSKIKEIRYFVVNSEQEALLLENALIKELQPKYNVLLKDGKSYPHITITNEPFPRVLLTRKGQGIHGTTFGPYPDGAKAKGLIELIRRLFPIRTCKHFLSAEAIEASKFRLCLQYHIHRCKGACRGYETVTQYQAYINQIREILKGNISSVKSIIKEEMFALSTELKFEEAQKKKQELILLENFESRSLVANTSYRNIDIFGFCEEGTKCYINYLHIDYGTIVKGDSIVYKRQIEEKKEDILALAIAEMRERHQSSAHEIVVPFKPNSNWGDEIEISIPQRGDKAKLLQLAEKNAKEVKDHQLKQQEKLNPQQREMRIMLQMQKDLRMDELPRHIECFDNSNLQGTNPVAACVVFKDSKPSKKDYRHFNIKTVEGPDDFASMKEILTRRYTRLMTEDQPLPQLVIVDGGKGQLSAAVDIIQNLSLTDHITLIGLAKRLEEIYFPGDPYPLYLDKNSDTIKVIQRLRDEAHRFGITFHRKQRSKSQIHSALDDIKGIGTQTKLLLHKQYKSIKAMRTAPEKELTELIGAHKTHLLLDHLNTPPHPHQHISTDTKTSK